MTKLDKELTYAALIISAIAILALFGLEVLADTVRWILERNEIHNLAGGL